MIRRPPRSTRTDTLFPYTTLFRSAPTAPRYIVGSCGGALHKSNTIKQINRVPIADIPFHCVVSPRSEEHTSELQSLMRISYAVFCLKKKKTNTTHIYSNEDNSLE